MAHNLCSQNRILSMLPGSSRRRAFAQVDFVRLEKHQRLATMGEPISYVYFLNSGIGSVLLTSSNGKSSEAGVFGNEGFSPSSLAVGGSRSPFDVVVQVEGDAYRMQANAFRKILAEDRTVEKIILRYVHVFAVQAAYTAHSNALDNVDVRLGRWLLMCHDRVPSNRIELTHDYLALMLAVRRPSVTTSLHVLEGEGFVRSTREVITIRNREALENFVGSSYGAAEHEYRVLVEHGADSDFSDELPSLLYGGEEANTLSA